MSTTKFIDKTTLEILDYNQMKAHASWPSPMPLQWPNNPAVSNIEIIWDYLITNNYLTTIPVDRYYELPEPQLKIWEIPYIPEYPDHVYQDALDDNKYKTNWQVRARDSEEMKPVNADVAYNLAYAKELRLQEITIEANGLYADASSTTINDILSLMDLIKNKNQPSTTVNWRGKKDEDGIPRWKNASMEDLQLLHLKVENKRQQGFNAEMNVFKRHMDEEYIDYHEDIPSIYDAEFDSLEEE